MGKVVVLKYKDINGTFPAGCQFAADSNSEVMGMRTIPLSDAPTTCGDNPSPTVNVLLILDPVYGQVWINQTLDSWATLIGGTAASGDRTRSTHFVIDGTTYPASTVLSSPVLFNVTILEVRVGQVPIDPTTITYSQDTSVTPNLGKITFPVALDVSDVVDVIYNYN